MTTPTVAERVAAGAAYLDQRMPGWHERIDLDRLDIRAPCNCILGQLHGDYTRAIRTNQLEKAAQRLGFNASFAALGREYDALTAAWRDLITTRRTPNDAGRISVAATGNWGQ